MEEQSTLIQGVNRNLEQQFMQHKMLEMIAEQIQLVENLSTLTNSKNSRLANESIKKINQIYKIAEQNGINVLESLNNYFTLIAQNDVFTNIKHQYEDIMRGLHDADAEMQE